MLRDISSLLVKLFRGNWASMVAQSKESSCNEGALGQEDPLEKDRLFTPVFLLGELHGQRSLAVTVHGVSKSWTRLSD